MHLSDSLVIMTSNAGSEHPRKLENPLGFVSREVNVAHVHADIQREVKRRFSPEFLNRIDEVVVFSPLTQNEAREIARRYLADITRVMAKSGKQLNFDEDALELMAVEGYSPQSGARFLKRAIDQRVKVPISKRWHTSSRFCVGARDGRVECVASDSDALGRHLSAPAAPEVRATSGFV